MLISIISFIVVFSAVTLAHEFGHYYFSRRAGIKILELGLGFGPRIYGFVVNRTLYSLNLIPFLGFIRIAGIDAAEEGKDDKYPEEESYVSKTPVQKFLSVFGGPLFNIILAFIIFYVMFVFTGVPSGISSEIATIAPGSVAEAVGIKSGDRIIAISGNKVVKITDAVDQIHKSAGKTLVLTIDRKGKILQVKAAPRLNKKLKIGLIGFSLKPLYTKTNPVGALYESLKQVAVTSSVILYTLGLLIIGKLSLFDLAGPVGIAQFTGQVAGDGIIPLLSFTAFLSINLGLLNLLPIPALDGGRLVFIVIGGIRRKAIDIKLENKIHQIGLTLLLALMAIVTVNDIFRIFRR
ncbi:MAG: RIP metalloprotease RseP [bacterium]